jgi:hypothetical protein
MTRLIPFAFLLTALPWLAGCPACYDAVQYLTVDFEQCEGLCGFAMTGEGDAYIAPTIHPGEHALFVDGAMRATIAVAVDIDSLAGAEPRIDFVTNCAADAYIDVTLRNDDDYALSIILGGGTRQVWAGDYRVVSVPLPRYFDDDGIYELRELRIVGTTGVCVVDQISIHTPEEC